MPVCVIITHLHVLKYDHLSRFANSTRALLGVAEVLSPRDVAVESDSKFALLSRVPAVVGSSARVISNVFSSPSTGISFTRPG